MPDCIRKFQEIPGNFGKFWENLGNVPKNRINRTEIRQKKDMYKNK
jgi:hypothetical protein